MKSAVYSFIALSDNSMVASVKVARFVASTLGLRLTSDARTLDKDLDVLIIVNGAYAFAKHLQELHDVVLGAGEAAEFDTRVPHGFGPAGEEPVEFLSLFGPQGERMHVRARPKRG